MALMRRNPIASFLAALVNVFWYVAVVLLALSVCLLLVSPRIGTRGLKVDLTIPVWLRMDATAQKVTSRSSDATDVRLQDVRGSLRFVPLSRGFVAATALVLTVVLALVLWVLAQLRAVFRTLRDGQPFVAVNAIRIRRIGWAVIVWEVFRSALVLVENYYATQHFSADGLMFDTRPDFNAFAVICGLIILVIAEVFLAGTRLAEEQSLTV